MQDMVFSATLEYISPKSVENNGANQFEIKAAITVPDSVTIRSGYSANAKWNSKEQTMFSAYRKAHSNSKATPPSCSCLQTVYPTKKLT